MTGGYTIEPAHPRSDFLIVNSMTSIIFSPDRLTGPPLARSLAPSLALSLSLSVSLGMSLALPLALSHSLSFPRFLSVCLPLTVARRSAPHAALPAHCTSAHPPSARWRLADARNWAAQAAAA